MTGEHGCGQFDGFAGEQRSLASAAIGLAIEFRGRYAVDGMAVRANDM